MSFAREGAFNVISGSGSKKYVSAVRKLGICASCRHIIRIIFGAAIVRKSKRAFKNHQNSVVIRQRRKIALRQFHHRRTHPPEEIPVCIDGIRRPDSKLCRSSSAPAADILVSRTDLCDLHRISLLKTHHHNCNTSRRRRKAKSPSKTV